MTITDFLFSWLVRSALLGLLILLVGSGAVLTLRQPVRRLRTIELVLCAVLLAPFLGMVPGYPQLPVVAWRSAAAKPQEPLSPPAIEPTPRPKVAGPPSLPASDRDAPPTPGVKATEARAPAWEIRPWLVAAYLAGVAVAIGSWLVGLAGLVRVLRTASPAPPRCRELLPEISAGRGDRVRLLTSRRLKQPFASVWGRATIVLPEDLCGDERALRWCLAHEWAHIARHDFRAWLLAGLARALFFYQPLVWWLRRQLRLCQDFLADAQAAGQASQAEDYAEFLTALAAKGKWRPAALGLSMRSGKSELYRRVIMLLKNQSLEERAGGFGQFRPRLRLWFWRRLRPRFRLCHEQLPRRSPPPSKRPQKAVARHLRRIGARNITCKPVKLTCRPQAGRPVSFRCRRGLTPTWVVLMCGGIIILVRTKRRSWSRFPRTSNHAYKSCKKTPPRSWPTYRLNSCPRSRLSLGSGGERKLWHATTKSRKYSPRSKWPRINMIRWDRMARSVDPTVARHNAARTQPPTGSAVATAD